MRQIPTEQPRVRERTSRPWVRSTVAQTLEEYRACRRWVLVVAFSKLLVGGLRRFLVSSELSQLRQVPRHRWLNTTLHIFDVLSHDLFRYLQETVAEHLVVDRTGS